MALFNYANREITAKVVYYGPGVCGKTTSLQYIHERIAPVQRGRLLSLATETDRTIFFDLLPLKLGEIRGFKLRFQLYTVPGQVKYNKTRKLVLQGADAIVFVADSLSSKREQNIESFRNLEENLREQGKQVEDLTIVYQYNKRDLPDVLPIEKLNQDLNPRNLPYFPSIATKGDGVMETLEAISKLALQDIETRLGATTSTEPAESIVAEELALTGEELLDLTGAGGDLAETALTFSSDELESLDLEADLNILGSSEKSIETRPIGYDHNILLEEVEIQQNIAHTGTLKESEFFNLQKIEEQALRELDAFLGGKDSDDSFEFDTFKRDTQPSAAEESDEEIFSTADQENVLDFSYDDEPTTQNAARFDASGLDFSFDTGGVGQTVAEAEALLETSEPGTLEADNVLEFTLEEEPEESVFGKRPQETSAKGEVETLELSERDLDLTFDQQEPEETETFPSFTLPEKDVRGESTSFTAEEDELLEFTLDEDSQPPDFGQKPPGSSVKGAIETLELSESDLDLSFGEDEAEGQKLSESRFEGSEKQFPGYPDFRITDSVRFEMQHSEEISSVTPFEKQLDELSEDIFTTEEELPGEEFQPEPSEIAKEEPFQIIADENTRLTVMAKHFYQQGEIYRAKQTVNENVLAILMYYTAIETELKAAALKYETCNPAVASLKIILDSLEEETGKTISGKKSIMDNIVRLKDNLQLETTYPDDETCELAARICDRFLTAFSQEFLSIDFTKLSPILAKPAEP